MPNPKTVYATATGLVLSVVGPTALWARPQVSEPLPEPPKKIVAIGCRAAEKEYEKANELYMKYHNQGIEHQLTIEVLWEKSRIYSNACQTSTDDPYIPVRY